MGYGSCPIIRMNIRAVAFAVRFVLRPISKHSLSLQSHGTGMIHSNSKKDLRAGATSLFGTKTQLRSDLQRPDLQRRRLPSCGLPKKTAASRYRQLEVGLSADGREFASVVDRV
jgi:hypothetical protein